MSEFLEAIGYIFLFMLPFLTYVFKNQLTEFFNQRAQRETDIPTGIINELPIKAIQNPFLLTLNHVKSSLKDGIYLQKIKSNLEDMNMLIAWDVNINKFYEEFERDIRTFLYDNETKFLSDCSVFVQARKINMSDYSEELHIEVPPEKVRNVSNLDNQIKKTYPVVLILYRTSLIDLTLNDIVCSTWVIHLKDNQMSTKILHNYTKCLSNRIITMNQIYNSDEENLCVACQTEKSNLVLLPCSHNCVCSECFKRIGRNCPVCRQTIQSHFEMRD